MESYSGSWNKKSMQFQAPSCKLTVSAAKEKRTASWLKIISVWELLIICKQYLLALWILYMQNIVCCKEEYSNNVRFYLNIVSSDSMAPHCSSQPLQFHYTASLLHNIVLCAGVCVYVGVCVCLWAGVCMCVCFSKVKMSLTNIPKIRVAPLQRATIQSSVQW